MREWKVRETIISSVDKVRFYELPETQGDLKEVSIPIEQSSSSYGTLCLKVNPSDGVIDNFNSDIITRTRVKRYFYAFWFIITIFSFGLFTGRMSVLKYRHSPKPTALLNTPEISTDDHDENSALLEIIKLIPDDELSLQNSSTSQYHAFQFLLFEQHNNPNLLTTHSTKQIVQLYILANIYHSLNGYNWNNSTNWLVDSVDACNWMGVRCIDDAIIELQLDQNNLQGSIPNEICYLFSLEVLSLSNNFITGHIPRCISLLSSLSQLHLDHNKIHGDIPHTIHDLTYLESINLSHNLIQGSISNSLGSLQYLETIDLSSNLLVGTIPLPIFSLKYIIVLDIHSNHMSGTLSKTVENLTNLQVLSLSQNKFTGAIPSSITKLENLEILNLNDNLFSGDIPHFHDMKLRQLRLEHNLLEGNIGIGSIFFGKMLNRRRMCDLKELESLSADCFRDSVICFCCTECF